MEIDINCLPVDGMVSEDVYVALKQDVLDRGYLWVIAHTGTECSAQILQLDCTEYARDVDSTECAAFTKAYVRAFREDFDVPF